MEVNIIKSTGDITEYNMIPLTTLTCCLSLLFVALNVLFIFIYNLISIYTHNKSLNKKHIYMYIFYQFIHIITVFKV